jgi:ankyrin repeat protein
MVKVLVTSKSINIKQTDSVGGNCLHYVGRNGNVTMAEILLQHGGKELLEVEDGQGRTPLLVAMDHVS